MINGKAIYQPKGAAAEYAKFACNFYIGCSNCCTYCFNKRWKWGNVPTLKKCFKDENNALEVFEKELKLNLPELQKHGLFFSFTTDPCLPKTVLLTSMAIKQCITYNVPVKILTKKTDWTVDCFYSIDMQYYKNIAFGFTLTGHDELEPNASTNSERIEAMQKLHEAGFKTWASIEPVIDFTSSWQMIRDTCSFCDLYKIGLMSGKKYVYKYEDELRDFMDACIHTGNPTIYFKDSLLMQAGICREDLPANCVDRDYDMFNP